MGGRGRKIPLCSTALTPPRCDAQGSRRGGACGFRRGCRCSAGASQGAGQEKGWLPEPCHHAHKTPPTTRDVQAVLALAGSQQVPALGVVLDADVAVLGRVVGAPRLRGYRARPGIKETDERLVQRMTSQGHTREAQTASHQRRFPTGGVAKGMPRNCVDLLKTRPVTEPYFVLTVTLSAASTRAMVASFRASATFLATRMNSGAGAACKERRTLSTS